MAQRPIFDAVTAMLVHGADLFLAQRHFALPAFPGYHAFPGGKVDKADSADALPGAMFEGQEPRLIRALARELREEIGFDLFAAVASGLVTQLACIGEITTPAFAPLRFRTWFYKVVLADKPAMELDLRESLTAEWLSVREWRQRYEGGRLLVAPPTRIAIEAMDADLHCVTLPWLDHIAEDDIPWVEPLGGLKILLVRSNTLPPATHTNVFWFGDAGSPRVLVDPSPADRSELERVCRRLDELGVDLVFLTHHHPDHREYADEIARRYRVPLAMSADTRARIEARAGAKYFEGVDVRLVAEDDELTRWQGEPVRVVAVPGHDEGQLAPMPDSKAWCIVGDLIQGVGTVVIAPPEGNMRKYFDSLKKIIALDPGVIIPSHGLALGGTHFLQQALKHRELREQEIYTRYSAGMPEDQILSEVYKGVDPRLLPLARLNIRSHLEKLREDGVIA
ncbi:MAG TPA: MBL fold metallo-hydrolase [Verrucomicrobiae bacterium]|nr:MBL fold metallo-hydrolase [Verrucomicrobiae bacterium]